MALLSTGSIPKYINKKIIEKPTIVLRIPTKLYRINCRKVDLTGSVNLTV